MLLKCFKTILKQPESSTSKYYPCIPSYFSTYTCFIFYKGMIYNLYHVMKLKPKSNVSKKFHPTDNVNCRSSPQAPVLFSARFVDILEFKN